MQTQDPTYELYFVDDFEARLERHLEIAPANFSLPIVSPEIAHKIGERRTEVANKAFIKNEAVKKLLKTMKERNVILTIRETDVFVSFQLTSDSL